MAIRIAFVGFRHGHIFSLYDLVKETPGVELAGACEEDAATRRELARSQKAAITHDRFDEMLDRAPCDAVAIGDYYVRRGSLAIRALERGKHIICDKPLATTVEEVEAIERLAKLKGLKVGLMLDLRDLAPFIGLRNLVRGGALGEIHAVSFGGQHPLMLGSRPAWYFEPGKHGGTINDIGIHAFDCIPWITGLEFKTVQAARAWNAFAKDFPHFKDSAQMMLTMNNGCGVLGDVSYHLPEGIGYGAPVYWRTTIFGRGGYAEVCAHSKEITLAVAGEKELRFEPLPPAAPGKYFQSFLRDLRGEAQGDDLCTRSVLRASRLAVEVQRAADSGSYNVPL